jgi:hypothetical protein
LIAVSVIDLEAGETLIDIGDEARLAHLAVGNDVDANVSLFAHDVRHCLTHTRIVSSVVDFFTIAARDAHRVKISRTRQTAYMGRENPVAALLHGIPSAWRSSDACWILTPCNHPVTSWFVFLLRVASRG